MVPREPSSSDTRAIVFIGRLDDVHEVEVAERRPLGLHRRAELLDLLLTSRMRDGLFLTVWTPSGVRVDSMM